MNNYLEFSVAFLGDHAPDVRLDEDGSPRFHPELPPDQIPSASSLQK